MEPRLASIIIKTASIQEMLRFYGLLGMEFTCKKISQGSQCHKAFLGTFEFSLYETEKAGAKIAPDFQLAFQIQNLDSLWPQLLEISGVQELLGPTLLPEGKKAILLDPEGRSVELTEAS